MKSVSEYSVEIGKTEQAVIDKIRNGELQGRIVDGEWFVTNDSDNKKPSDKPQIVEVTTNAGKIGFFVGMAAALYVWFGINALEYNLRFVSVFDAVTNLSLMQANGLYFALSKEQAIIALLTSCLISGIVFGWIFHLVAGKKKVVTK